MSGIHQTRSTGQTNLSISHMQPLNVYATTKGIGLRRKFIAAALIEIPLRPKFQAKKFLKKVLEAAGLAEDLFPRPTFHAKKFLKKVIQSASLVATLSPPPCTRCIGKYRILAHTLCANCRCTTNYTVEKIPPAICKCNGKPPVPAIPRLRML